MYCAKTQITCRSIENPKKGPKYVYFGPFFIFLRVEPTKPSAQKLRALTLVQKKCIFFALFLKT